MCLDKYIGISPRILQATQVCYYLPYNVLKYTVTDIMQQSLFIVGVNPVYSLLSYSRPYIYKLQIGCELGGYTYIYICIYMIQLAISIVEEINEDQFLINSLEQKFWKYKSNFSWIKSLHFGRKALTYINVQWRNKLFKNNSFIPLKLFINKWSLL